MQTTEKLFPAPAFTWTLKSSDPSSGTPEFTTEDPANEQAGSPGAPQVWSLGKNAPSPNL
jgi:predicted secreted protein